MRQGEVLGILGPTGAGEDHHAPLHCGPAQAGRGDDQARRRRCDPFSPMERDIAVVFEGFNLLPTLSVFDNIAFPLRSPLYLAPEDEVRRA